jgi:hypothetical protein
VALHEEADDLRIHGAEPLRCLARTLPELHAEVEIALLGCEHPFDSGELGVGRPFWLVGEQPLRPAQRARQQLRGIDCRGDCVGLCHC